jgi:hypothetical protein
MPVQADRVRAMKLAGSMILAGVLWGGYQAYNHHQAAKALREVLASSDVNGFVELPLPAEQNSNAIYVVAAQNCPRAAAQRANLLTKQLEDRGLPVVRTSQVMFRQGAVDRAGMNRLNAVMSSPLPLVFIHGRAASNPELVKVVAEYQGSSSRTRNPAARIAPSHL